MPRPLNVRSPYEPLLGSGIYHDGYHKGNLIGHGSIFNHGFGDHVVASYDKHGVDGFSLHGHDAAYQYGQENHGHWRHYYHFHYPTYEIPIHGIVLPNKVAEKIGNIFLCICYLMNTLDTCLQYLSAILYYKICICLFFLYVCICLSV